VGTSSETKKAGQPIGCPAFYSEASIFMEPGSVPRMNYFGTSPRESAPATIALESLRLSINAATNEVKKKNLSGVPERKKLYRPIPLS
jgi:hypothetical protein